ncbi:MAG: hydantoinase/oxoprolinase family protein [Lautropia sp.]
MHQIGIDVGGTFTDLVVADAVHGVRTLKVLSTPDDFSTGVLDGVDRLVAAQALSPAAIDRLVHAFTVATNALLTRSGARVGLITTRGFRDVLEIGRLRMPKLYDMAWDKPPPLVRRALRHEVTERIAADGSIVTPLDEPEVIAAIDAMQASGVESVAICLLHAYVNDTHERRIAELIATRAPALTVSASHRVLPEIREFERTSTTVVNAFVRPAVDAYLGRLEAGLERVGARAPLMVMQSAGGVMRSTSARELPSHCIESGPAAGAIGAAALGKRHGLGNLIAFDMGGTTAKVCLIEDGEPRLTAELEVGAALNAGQRLLSGGGYVVRAPALDLAEIGAGGGSLARIDAGGALRVGPGSAGAHPGPVCYGRGGTTPTVTDANVVLGFLSRSHLLDGAMAIDAAAAQTAIDDAIARPLGITVHDAAWGIHAVADATMVRAVQAVTSEIGRSPADFTMIAFGGSGPVHAATLAAAAGIRRIVVPPASGVFSAFGLLFTRIEHRLVRTVQTAAGEADPEQLRLLARQLAAEAAELMRAEGVAPADSESRLQLDLRYRGQSSELSIPFDSDPDRAAIERAVAAFHDEHARTYGYSSPSEPVQIVNLRLLIRARDPGGELSVRAEAVRPAIAGAGAARQSAPTRSVYFGPAGWHDCPALRRNELTDAAPGRTGPLVIEEYDTTIVVPPHAQVYQDSTGCVRITLAAADGECA